MKFFVGRTEEEEEYFIIPESNCFTNTQKCRAGDTTLLKFAQRSNLELFMRDGCWRLR